MTRLDQPIRTSPVATRHCPNKTTVALNYDEADRLQTVVTRDGSRRLTFGYQGDTDRLVSVKDWLDPAREVRFGYDEQGRLATFADRLGAVTRYAYHGETSWLKEVVNARGNADQTMEHYPNGWIKKLSGARDLPGGHGMNVVYETLDDGAPRTTMTSPPSAYAPETPTVMIDTYDPSGRIVRDVTDPASPSEIELAYDGFTVTGICQR